jgi:hypothetical protein
VIQQKFFQLVKGEAPDPYGWLQPVTVPALAAGAHGAKDTASGAAKIR